MPTNVFLSRPTTIKNKFKNHTTHFCLIYYDPDILIFALEPINIRWIPL